MTLALSTRGYLGSGSGGATGAIVSINAIATRWDPLIAVTTCPPENLFLFYQAGNNKFTLYDPVDEFTEFFADRSTIVDNGDDTWTITMLPNGGWWQKNFTVKFVAGTEMEIA